MHKWFQYVALLLWFQSGDWGGGGTLVCLLLLYQPLPAPKVRLEQPAWRVGDAAGLTQRFCLFILSTGEGLPPGEYSSLAGGNAADGALEIPFNSL